MVAHSVSPQHYWYDWNEYTIEGLKLNKGLNKLAIHMDNFMPNVDYFDIVVNPEARKLTDIKIQNFPKISYTEGDVFDPSNMVVIATYSNGHSYGATGFTYDKTAALTPADTEVTISFGGLTAILRIKVKSLSNPYPGQNEVNIDETIKVEAEDCSVYKPDGTLTDTNLYVENHSDTENNPNTSGGRSIGIWMNQSQFTITVRIHSDVAGKVVVKMCAAKSSPYIVDDNTVIKWNDNKVTTGLTIQNADGAQYVWHDWHVYTLGEFELKEGINELTITLNEGAEAINLDYFEFVAA